MDTGLEQRIGEKEHPLVDRIYFLSSYSLLPFLLLYPILYLLRVPNIVCECAVFRVILFQFEELKRENTFLHR